MIKGLQIQNFKCFQNSPLFNFSKLNLLTGINGRGKSSLLQTFLILSQTARKNSDLKQLFINDEFVQLGNFDDIKNSETTREKNIQFNLKFYSTLLKEAKFEYKENEKDALLADLQEISIIDSKDIVSTQRKATKEQNENVLILADILRKIHFVSADRLGPVKYVDKTNLPEFIHVGTTGEHSINILHNSDKLPLVNDNLYLGQDAKSVIQQTEEWLNYILEGAKIEIIGKDKQSSVLSLLINSRKNSYSYKPNNVGFGYSYILPLVLTGLIAKEGDIIIVENPEAHLHPRAQSKITEFFAKVASCGVQVFIESHSEHILNGLRVCALNPEVKISHNDISITYFNEGFTPKTLSVDEKGKIENWPEGFFDQQEIDLANIFRFSK